MEHKKSPQKLEKYLEKNKMETEDSKTYRMQQKQYSEGNLWL